MTPSRSRPRVVPAVGVILLVLAAIPAFWAVYFLVEAPVRTGGVDCGTVLAPSGPHAWWSSDPTSYEQDCVGARAVGAVLGGASALGAAGLLAGGVILVRSSRRPTESASDS